MLVSKHFVTGDKSLLLSVFVRALVCLILQYEERRTLPSGLAVRRLTDEDGFVGEVLWVHLLPHQVRVVLKKKKRRSDVAGG